MERQSKVSWKQGMLNLEYASPQLSPPTAESGAIPNEALGREQQMFKAWKEQLDEETQLLEKIASVETLRKAYKRVKGNKGAAGVDGMTVDDLTQWLKDNPGKLRKDLLNGTYRPEAVRGVSIPKPNGGERQLGIPTVIDRLVQQAVVEVLQPILDPQMSKSSYGFRPRRSAMEALIMGKHYAENGRRIAVDLDLEKFFDKVNHDVLMERMARRIKDKRLLYYIRQMLTAGMMDNDGIEQAREQGTPQGGPLSPLLANVLLDDLDKELEKRGHKFCRYADDCMIFVKTMKAGQRVLASVTRFIESKLKLKVNREKSQVDYVTRRTYLGYRISPKQLRVAPKSVESLKNKVRLIARRGRPTPIEQVIEELNPLIRGWAGYYKHAAFKTKSGELDAWIRRKLRCMRLKQCKHPKGIKRLLEKLKYKPSVIHEVTGMGRRWWRISKTWPSHGAMNNAWFREQGLLSLQDWFQPRV